jgi:hypothetical protein
MVMVIHLMVMVMRSSPDARGPTPYIPAEVARPPRPGYDNPDAEQLRRLFLPRAQAMHNEACYQPDPRQHGRTSMFNNVSILHHSVA